MSKSGDFLNNKYSLVFGIAAGLYFTKDYDSTLLTIGACIVGVIIFLIIFNILGG